MKGGGGQPLGGGGLVDVGDLVPAHFIATHFVATDVAADVGLGRVWLGRSSMRSGIQVKFCIICENLGASVDKLTGLQLAKQLLRVSKTLWLSIGTISPLFC